jgi:L-ascorbate metabolism protein UlaG (beta-lactamase superfamily)
VWSLPCNQPVPNPSRPAITWLGHATTLIELGGTRILTDPVLGDRVGLLRRIVRSVPAGSVDDLDGILLSHLHADHADLPSLRRLTGAAPVLAPSDAVAWLQRRGLHDVRGLRPGDTAALGEVRIRATPAVHDRRRRPLGPQAEPIGFLASGQLAVYFAGDTDLFEGMSELRGAVDVALLPIWGWGPTLGPGHLDPERAARAAAIIDPRVVIPIHWGTLAPPFAPRRGADSEALARRFADLAKRYAPGVDVRLLAPGDRIEL